ncbi:MAG: peptidyl-prolyl cis-trans isomerase, partial [Planctomycetota bacterium]|nr:peptidyl-prolyl cis-trans isomerase [Planctomycetota bacterium]
LIRPAGKGEDPVQVAGQIQPEQWMAARQRAAAVAAEARGGAKFETLVVRYSDDRPEIIRRFGAMAGLSAKETDPAVAEALAKMSPGEISNPIRTPEGFQIVRLERKIPPRRSEFEEVRDCVERDYLAEQMALKGDLMLRELRERAAIEYLMDMALGRSVPGGRRN